MHWYRVDLYHLCAVDPNPGSVLPRHNLHKNLRISPVFSKKWIIPGWNPAGEVVGDASWVLLELLGQHSLSFLSSPITSPNRLFLLLLPVNYRICELAVLWGKNQEFCLPKCFVLHFSFLQSPLDPGQSSSCRWSFCPPPCSRSGCLPAPGCSPGWKAAGWKVCPAG